MCGNIYPAATRSDFSVVVEKFARLYDNLVRFAVGVNVG